MSDLYQIQKARCIKLENDDDDNGSHINKLRQELQGKLLVCGKKGHRKQHVPQKTKWTEDCKTKWKGNCDKYIKMSIFGTKKKM